MEWKDLAGLIGKSAPILGTLVGGPAGGAVGGLIASVLGVGSDPDAVKQALTINPDAAVKLAEIEAKKATELQSLLIQGEQNRLAAESAAYTAEVDNTKSAREMQVQLRSYVPAVLASVITLGFLGILIGAMLGVLKVADSPAFILLLGSLATAWGGVVNYYFGSSIGSHNKDKIAALKA